MRFIHNCICMKEIKERRIVILVNLFAFMALLTMLAPFSIYKLPGIYWISMIFLVLSYLSCSRNQGVLSDKRKEMFIFGCGWTIVYSISVFFNSSLPVIGNVFAILYGVLFLNLNREIQKFIINRFVWLLAIVLFFSIIEFLLYQLTHVGFVIGYVTRTTDVRVTYFVHLLFNIILSSSIIPRFQCLAEEAGLIGTLCGFLIFFTWRVKSMRFPFFVFLLSGLLSFSLAYYLFLAVFLLTNLKFNFRNFVIMLFISIVLFQTLKDSFELLILSRIEDTEGIDNRTTDMFDHYYNKALANGQLWLGVGADNLPRQITMGESGGNAGAKKWIFQYGIVGFIIVFLVYNTLYRLRKNNRMFIYDWVFLLVFWLSFYQRETILNSYTLLVFLAMPICNEFQIENRTIKIEDESYSTN